MNENFHHDDFVAVAKKHGYLRKQQPAAVFKTTRLTHASIPTRLVHVSRARRTYAVDVDLYRSPKMQIHYDPKSLDAELSKHSYPLPNKLATVKEAAMVGALDGESGVRAIKTNKRLPNPDKKLEPRAAGERDFKDDHPVRLTKYPEDQEDTHKGETQHAAHQPYNGELSKVDQHVRTSSQGTTGEVSQTPRRRGDQRDGDIAVVRTSPSAVRYDKNNGPRMAFRTFREQVLLQSRETRVVESAPQSENCTA